MQLSVPSAHPDTAGLKTAGLPELPHLLSNGVNLIIAANLAFHAVQKSFAFLINAETDSTPTVSANISKNKKVFAVHVIVFCQEKKNC